MGTAKMGTGAILADTTSVLPVWATIYLGGTSQDYNGKWARVERDIIADASAMWPGETFVRITGFSVYAGGVGTWVRADDWTFSNSLTVEHNTLGGGVIGHILRNRTINPTTLVATDRWFHYDQVGSVMSVSNGSGALVTKVDQDAFGNVMASWQTGLWTDTYASRAGWHHNTKEFDADAGMVYMYQRWYQPEVGIFSASAKEWIFVEHRFTAFLAGPAFSVDPKGLRPLAPADIVPAMRMPPLPSGSGICGIYCPNDDYMGYSARCVCEGAGDSPWDQKVRGCLAYLHAHGVNPGEAHKFCYAANSSGLGGLATGAIEAAQIGAFLTPKCLYVHQMANYFNWSTKTGADIAVAIVDYVFR